MTGYIKAIKRMFRDQYRIVPTGGTEDEPTFTDSTIQDGEYSMAIGEEQIKVRIRQGRISFDNFKG